MADDSKQTHTHTHTVKTINEEHVIFLQLLPKALKIKRIENFYLRWPCEDVLACLCLHLWSRFQGDQTWTDWGFSDLRALRSAAWQWEPEPKAGSSCKHTTSQDLLLDVPLEDKGNSSKLQQAQVNVGPVGSCCWGKSHCFGSEFLLIVRFCQVLCSLECIGFPCCARFLCDFRGFQF